MNHEEAYVEKRGRTWVVIDAKEAVMTTLSRRHAERYAVDLNEKVAALLEESSK